MSAADTRTRLLDAAETLFGEHGFRGASLRALTRQAGVNVAAVNYHFGSKEALLREAVARRVEPINAERLRRLDRIEAEAGDGQLPLEALLRAFVAPMIELGPGPEERSRLQRFAARMHAEPPEILGPLLADLFGEVARRFAAATSRACPHLGAAEVGLRLSLTVGVALALLSDGAPSVIPEAPSVEKEPELVLERTIAFLAAGFRAPDARRGSEAGRPPGAHA